MSRVIIYACNQPGCRLQVSSATLPPRWVERRIIDRVSTGEVDPGFRPEVVLHFCPAAHHTRGDEPEAAKLEESETEPVTRPGETAAVP